MNAFRCMPLLIVTAVATLHAQGVFSPPPNRTAGGGELLAALPPGGQTRTDPGYRIYREGYKLILGGSWAEAYRTLARVTTSFPESRYVEDARYWSAYASKQIDPAKAVDAYERFIKEFPSSRYFEDAVVDFVTLKTSAAMSALDHLPTELRDLTPAPPLMPYELRYGFHGSLPAAGLRIDMEDLPDSPPGEDLQRPANPASSEIRNRESGSAFRKLKQLALDTGQPADLREAAVNSLSSFENFDALPVLARIARQDPNEEVQVSAISLIGEATRDKDRALDTLIGIFEGLQGHPSDQRGTALYAIADAGGERAVDFLINVARTSGDGRLRSDALYYLGTIGGERARRALIHILDVR